MKTIAKLIILAFIGSTIYSFIFFMSSTKSKNADNPILEAKNCITEEVEQAKDYITNQIYETAKNKKLDKNNIIKTANKIQKKIKTTSQHIEENIEKTINSNSHKIDKKIPKEIIRDTINKAKTDIKKDMKKAYKEIKKRIIRILREKNMSEIVNNAKQIKDTTYQTSEKIKDKINIAYQEITNLTQET